MKCPTQPSLRVRPKVGARFMFWFMGGVGDWFLGNAPPTPPLGLESRFIFWFVGGVGGYVFSLKHGMI